MGPIRDQLDRVFLRKLRESGELEGVRGRTRVQLVADVAGGFDPGHGAVIFAGGYGYLRVIGATEIDDLPGYVPYGEAMLDHWAVVYNDSGVDNTDAINAAWAWCAASGVPCFAKPGTIWHGGTLTIPDGLDFRATVYGKTTFKKQAGFNGRQVVSAGFDTYTGTEAADTCPADITMIGVKFDGNWMLNDWFSETNSYVNTSGGGFYVYARRYEIDIDVINQAGIGFWSELNGEPESLSDRKKARSRIQVGVTKEEGIIFKGPGDMSIPEMWCFATGTRIYSEREAATTPRSSPTYGAENGGVTDGIVFDGKGAEIGTIHSWAHHSGGPLWTKGRPRIHCELLIGESSAIGPRIAGQAYGHIGHARIHNNKGGWSGLTPGLWPDFKISTAEGFIVNSVWIKPSTNGGDKGQDRLVVDGVNCQVHGGRIESAGYPGHGVVLGGNYNEVRAKVSACKGAPANGDGISYALKRIAPFSDRTMDAHITASDCDGYFLSSGTPNQERIEILFRGLTGQVPFSGDIADAGNAQRWDIYGEIDNMRIMSRTKVDALFDSSLTAEQTLTIPHRLLHAPSVRNIMLSIWDSSTNSQISGADQVQYCYVHAVDATNITVKVKMAVAHVTNTSPRVSADVSI